MVVEKMLICLTKVKSLACIKQRKHLKETAETTKIGLRTLQRIIINWKDSEEPSSLGKKCHWKKILNNLGQ